MTYNKYKQLYNKCLLQLKFVSILSGCSII